MKKIIFCRNCESKNLEFLFSLGKLSYTGKFPKNIRANIKSEKLNLIKCKKCNLVQLDRNFNPSYLYNKDYGYRSGINNTMTKHLNETAIELSKIVKLKKGDFVLDIASNDGTLLNAYRTKGIKTVGIDPILKKFKIYYKKINFKISDFFSYRSILKTKINKKFKIITAISMFYDLQNPNKFLSDIEKIIDKKNGIFLLEHADLLSIIKNNLFDTICHEHLEYYSSDVIIRMTKNNNLRVYNIKYNKVNGGSARYYICHKNSVFKERKERIKNVLKEEINFGLKNKRTYKIFFSRINKIKKNLKFLLKNIKIKKGIIHGYGASTKGNVLLQFFSIGRETIDYISDRNPIKSGCFTPGTKIQIVNEEFSRSLNPDYYLVLPWHFKKEILEREKRIINKGTKFIFPLPNISRF
jgi:2-polyprenyl-3-methyl-5-hydroxy-6-metoxy-1,4-benzoquinol methylase